MALISCMNHLKEQRAAQRPVAEHVEGEACHYQNAADKLNRRRTVSPKTTAPATMPTTKRERRDRKACMDRDEQEAELPDAEQEAVERDLPGRRLRRPDEKDAGNAAKTNLSAESISGEVSATPTLMAMKVRPQTTATLTAARMSRGVTMERAEARRPNRRAELRSDAVERRFVTPAARSSYRARTDALGEWDCSPRDKAGKLDVAAMSEAPESLILQRMRALERPRGIRDEVRSAGAAIAN